MTFLTCGLCQQYTCDATTELTQSKKGLETQVAELQTLANSTADQGHLDSLKSKKSAITNLLSIAVQGTLLRSRFFNIAQMALKSQSRLRPGVLLPVSTENSLGVSGHIVQTSTASSSVISLKSALLTTGLWQLK